MPLSVSTPVPELYVPLIAAWLVKTSSSPASKPADSRTTAPSRLVSSTSATVSPPSTTTAAAFSLYAVAPALVVTAGASLTFVTVIVNAFSNVPPRLFVTRMRIE